jgi:O-antigen ligase
MISGVRQLVAPFYLFLCLIIGGSAQGIWGNMVLQLMGLAIIAWAAMSRDDEPLVEPARQLLWIAILALAVVAVQLVPLPGSLWPHLGARQRIADGYRILGLGLPALPLSLTPYKTLDSVLGFIPPLAVFCAIVRLKAYRGSYMAAALLAGAVAGILLGTLQVASSVPTESPWYLYPETNPGYAVGFFANANHMATLLVISLPFLAALAAAAKGANIQRYSAFLALTAGVGLVVVVGIALNGSLAGYGLVLPVLAASALIILPPGNGLRTGLMILAAVLLAGAIAFIATSSIGSSSFGSEAATSVQSRQEILTTTMRGVKDYFAWGSGLGSFRDVYFLYEDPTGVGGTYVVHAHNDYAELALETGIAGTAILILFLLWWGAALRRVWDTAETGSFARAASVASAAILAHSLVDFPLRTAAISAAFGMCLALLADRRPPQIADASDLRPTRHFVLR